MLADVAKPTTRALGALFWNHDPDDVILGTVTTSDLHMHQSSEDYPQSAHLPDYTPWKSNDRQPTREERHADLQR